MNPRDTNRASKKEKEREGVDKESGVSEEKEKASKADDGGRGRRGGFRSAFSPSPIPTPTDNSEWARVARVVGIKCAIGVSAERQRRAKERYRVTK